MNTLSITLSNARQIDGFVEAANRAGMTPEALALDFLSQQGQRYADDFRIGNITSAAFISRFTPAEYGAILTAAAEDSEDGQAVAGLIAQLTASPNVALDDPRLQPGLELLVGLELLDAARPAEILAYSHPEPAGLGE